MMAAKELEKAAKNLAKAEKPPAFALPTFGAGINADPVGAREGLTISGAGTTPVLSPDNAGPSSTPGDLGAGFNKDANPTNLSGNAPTPGAFGAPPGGAPAASAGNGAVGGGGTSVAKDESGADAQAKYADLAKKSPEQYGVGGGSVPSNGGGGGAGTAGPDLSGLLAQFLPKPEEDKPKNGTMDFGGRSPASDEPFSLLDKSANIFKRVHETYQEKQKRAVVGI